MNSKKGSSAVFLMAVAGALVSVTLAMIYGVREECMRSRIDGIAALASESVMSEYDRDIQEEYGLFILNGRDDELRRKFLKYIRYSTDNMKNVDIQHAEISGAGFSTANIDLIKDQILEYTELMDAEDMFGRRNGYTEKEKNTTRIKRTLRHGPTAVSLPSSSIADRSIVSEAGSGLKDTDDVFRKGTDKYRIGKYIEEHFSSRTNNVSDRHFFCSEVEYIIGGELSDEKNESKVRRALRVMKFPMNLAHIYSDAEKRAETAALAEVIAPGPGAPAAQAALAVTWAYAETDNDLDLLWEGYKVPLVKDDSTWAVSLENAHEGIKDGVMRPAQEKGIGYDRYLQILLYMKSDDVKIARIMDLIQINTRMDHDSDFLITEQSAGISVHLKVNGVEYAYEKKY